MALGAIDLDGSVVMALAAEMFRVLDRYRLIVCVFDNMTGETLFQAVLLGADTLVHGFIALMK